MDRNPVPAKPTAPISEDSDPIVRVPVVELLTAMPYYDAQQHWEFHQAQCPDCGPDGVFPCETGGDLALIVGDALVEQRDAARWN